MRKVFKIITIVLWFSLFFHSCCSYRSELIKGKGSIEEARLNCITDFANTYKTPKKYLNERKGKPFQVFEIVEYKLKDDMYGFIVIPEIDGNVSLTIRDTLGKVPLRSFPNRFKVKNDKLFYWTDNITPLNQDVLNVLDEFGVLDSIDIKRELGLLPENFEDTRMVTLDHRLKTVTYFVCKNNVSDYKKVINKKGFKYNINFKCSVN